MEQARRIGYLSSIGLALVCVVYAVVVALGILEVGSDDPIVGPTLAIMESLTLLSVPLIVAVMGSICVYAPQERKVFGVMALSFSAIMAGLTSAVHFVALTAGRQAGFTALEWPSALYAIELLAWDVFLGFGLLSAAYVFPGSGIRANVRWSLLITGFLCLVGAIGPILGDMVMQRVGMLGYGIALPISSLILARFFRHEGRVIHGAKPESEISPGIPVRHLNKPLKPVPGLMTVYRTPLSRLCLKR